MAGLRHFWADLTFVGRLLTTASLALLVSGAALLMVSARQDAQDIRQRMEQTLAQELQTLPATLAEIVVVGDFSTLQQSLDRYALRPSLRAVSYTDASGIRLEAVNPEPPSTAPAWFLLVYHLQAVQGEMPVVVGGRSYGRVSVRVSPDRASERAWVQLQNHLAVLLLAIGLDFVGIWWILRVGLKPLRLLVRAVNEVADGQLKVRLPLRGSPEFLSLILAFNRMAQVIESDQFALREGNERFGPGYQRGERRRVGLEFTNPGAVPLAQTQRNGGLRRIRTAQPHRNPGGADAPRRPARGHATHLGLRPRPNQRHAHRVPLAAQRRPLGVDFEPRAPCARRRWPAPAPSGLAHRHLAAQATGNRTQPPAPAPARHFGRNPRGHLGVEHSDR